MADKRKFKRLPANLVTCIRMQQVSEQARKAFLTRISDISVGGVFIETHSPFPVGTLVEFDFELPGLNQKVHAQGIVRWSCDERIQDRQAGMGIEFLKVSVSETQAIHAYVSAEDARQTIIRLTRTALHQDLLRFVHRKAGQTMLFEVLKNYLGSDPASLREALCDFEEAGIIRYTHGNEVQLLGLPEGTIREQAEAWMQNAGGNADPKPGA